MVLAQNGKDLWEGHGTVTRCAAHQTKAFVAEMGAVIFQKIWQVSYYGLKCYVNN